MPAERSLPRTLLQGRYVRLIALCVLGAVLCALAGRWQYHRWQYKRAANSELRASAAAGTVPADQLLSMDRPLPVADTYRTVTATGSWDRGGELYLRARQVDNQLAYLVVTPLRLTDGHTLLVVRGWQPATGSATQRPPTPAAPPGQVSVTARVYPGEPGELGTGLPAREIDRLNTTEIGTRLGTPVYRGYAELISQQPPDTALPTLPPPDLGNPAGGADQWQHLAYVVQWYCFALLLLAAPFVLAAMEGRERRPGREREDPRNPRDLEPAR